MTAAGRPIRGGCGSFWPKRASRCRLEQVDLGGAWQHKSPAFTAINPLQRVPALVLDDGTVITESIAICRYFEELQPEPPLFGAARRRKRAGRDVEAAAGASSAVADLARVPQHPSGHEGDGGAAGAGLGGGQQAAHHGISRACSTRELEDRPFVAGDQLQRRRHHRPGRGRFHEAGQARGARTACAMSALARRGVGAAERARPERCG